MKTVTSFTGANNVRYPAPDIARGGMLLLIALANIGWWSGASWGGDPSLPLFDQVWIFMRTALVDHRAYPLFAMLFGFGLVTMVNLRVQADVDQTVRRLMDHRFGPGWSPEAVPQWLLVAAHQEAVVDARRLVRRRGLWMILFGLIHGLVFPGDIIGTYGVVAVVLAGVFARKNRTVIAVIGVVFFILSVTLMWGVTLVNEMDTGAAAGAMSGESQMPVLGNFGEWLVITFFGAIMSMVVPGTMVGARLADTTIISDPDPQRSKLLGIGVMSLLLALVISLPVSLYMAGWIEDYPSSWAEPLNTAGGFIGALGWLALFVAWAGSPPADGVLRGVRSPLAAMGRMSMTAYISQTVLFFFIFSVLNWTGVSESVGPLGEAGIATLVWILTLIGCVMWSRTGKRGPLEVLLRTLVARSARRRPDPFAPMIAEPLGMGAVPPQDRAPGVPQWDQPDQRQDSGRSPLG